MAKISEKAVQMPASAIRKLVPFADAAKKQGVKVYHLSPGQRSIQPSTRQSMCSSCSPTSISMSSFVIIFNASQRTLFLR